MSDKSKFIKINANGNKPTIIPVSAICCITEDSFSSRLTFELMNGNRVEAKYALADFLKHVQNHADIIDLIAD